jgi:AcrR family transcriptional regulator
VDEDGFGGLTIEGIAARAGVGKPTIYRRWRSKDELVAHVLGHLDPPPDPVVVGDGDTAELRSVLVAQLDSLRRRFVDTRTGRIWVRLIGEAASQPELARIYTERFVQPRTRAIAELLRTRRDGGELRADLDVDRAVSVLTDSMLGALLQPGRVPADDHAEAIVDLLLDGMLAAPR